MIELLKLNGMVVFVNPDLIRFVEQSPDTLLVFGDGKTLLVKNKPQEVLDKIIEYRRLCVLPTLK
jgi:flagellar protein FlbD